MVGYADANGGLEDEDAQARTRTDARAERDAFLAKLRRGEIAPPSKLTFGEVVAEYLTSIREPRRGGEKAERTLERYRSALDLHVLPTLGTRPIQKITADQLAALVGHRTIWACAVDGPRDRHAGTQSVRPRGAPRLHRREPDFATSSRRDAPGRSQTEPADAHDRRGSRRSSRLPARYRPLLAVAVFSGMRIQEILGLTWGDIDFRERRDPRASPAESRHEGEPGATRRSEDEGRPARHRARRQLEPLSP